MKIKEGVKLFDPGLDTGLLTDWCQDGIGHILCQKHCGCPLLQEQQGDKAPPADLNCCTTRWKVCSVSSRFGNSAEANYSPTDREFTALVDALEKTAYFTGDRPTTTHLHHQWDRHGEGEDPQTDQAVGEADEVGLDGYLHPLQ